MAALLASTLIWMLAALCWVSIEVIVRKVEEPYLRALHGAKFEDYEKSSNRYFPW